MLAFGGGGGVFFSVNFFCLATVSEPNTNLSIKFDKFVDAPPPTLGFGLPTFSRVSSATSGESCPLFNEFLIIFKIRPATLHCGDEDVLTFFSTSFLISSSKTVLQFVADLIMLIIASAIKSASTFSITSFFSCVVGGLMPDGTVPNIMFEIACTRFSLFLVKLEAACVVFLLYFFNVQQIPLLICFNMSITILFTVLACAILYSIA